MGAASPVCTRAGIVMNASVAEANTHGASGIAQLNARALPWRAGIDCSGSRAVAGAVTAARCAARTATIVATTTMAAAIPNDTEMPGCPAEAMTPEVNGPMAKPAVKTAPATAAPAGPFRSEAHAVHELMARPTPIPTIKRPTSNTAECCESSIATVPNRAVVDPAHATDWRPSASDTRPPMSRPGSSPTA
jgi:hypothetical protein